MSLGTDLFVKLHRRLFAAFATMVLAVPVYAGNNPFAHHDHVELDAALVAPYQSERASDARTFALKFSYPTDATSQVAQWRVQLRTPEGALVEEWRGRTPLESGKAEVNIDWAGRVGANALLADGI